MKRLIILTITVIVNLSQSGHSQDVNIKLEDPNNRSVQFFLIIKNESDPIEPIKSDENGSLIIKKEIVEANKDNPFVIIFPKGLFSVLYDPVVCDSICTYEFITGEPYIDACNCNYSFVGQLTNNKEGTFYVPRTKVAYIPDWQRAQIPNEFEFN